MCVPTVPGFEIGRGFLSKRDIEEYNGAEETEWRCYRSHVISSN
jgi:hypothetical protein